MVYVINPIDPTIKSLRRLARHLSQQIPALSTIFIFPGDCHKYSTYDKLEKLSNDTSIIFMGHGRSDALFGSKGKYWNAMFNDELDETNDYFYNDEDFITEETYSLFAGKRLIIFACNSTDLSEKLLENGASVVMGFHRLPTSVDEFRDDWGIQASDHLIAAMNGCLNIAFRNTITKACLDHLCFSQIESLMKLELQRQIVNVLTSRAHYRYQLVNTLSHIKRDIKVVGQRNLRLE